jgi:hypothetical protein
MSDRSQDDTWKKLRRASHHDATVRVCRPIQDSHTWNYALQEVPGSGRAQSCNQQHCIARLIQSHIPSREGEQPDRPAFVSGRKKEHGLTCEGPRMSHTGKLIDNGRGGTISAIRRIGWVRRGRGG